MAEPVPQDPRTDTAKEQPLKLIGTAFRRVDGRAKVTGADASSPTTSRSRAWRS